MDAHRVEVLDRADNDAVAGRVAHDLELELLPADERLLDEHLAHRRHLETASYEGCELRAGLGDAAAEPAQSERRSDDRRNRQAVQVGSIRNGDAARHLK